MCVRTILVRRTPSGPLTTVLLREVSRLNFKQSNVHYKQTFTTLLSKSAIVYTLRTGERRQTFNILQFTVI